MREYVLMILLVGAACLQMSLAQEVAIVDDNATVSVADNSSIPDAGAADLNLTDIAAESSNDTDLAVAEEDANSTVVEEPVVDANSTDAEGGNATVSEELADANATLGVDLAAGSNETVIDPNDPQAELKTAILAQVESFKTGLPKLCAKACGKGVADLTDGNTAKALCKEFCDAEYVTV